MLSCPYCGNQAKLVTGKEVYPHRPDLYQHSFYQCAPCDAYVGTHKGTKKALGRLANAELRRLKLAAHAVFDPIWKSGTISRTGAYKWLSEQMQLKPSETHIGMFDEQQCKQVITLCK